MNEKKVKTFRCDLVYQDIIKRAKGVYKFTTDSEVILYGLRLIRSKMKSSSYNITDFNEPATKKFMRKWRENLWLDMEKEISPKKKSWSPKQQVLIDKMKKKNQI